MRFNKVSANIGGEDRLFVFTMSTIKDFCDFKGINAGNIAEVMMGIDKHINERLIFFAAYRMGFVYNDMEPPEYIKNPLKLEEFVDSMGQSEYDKVIKCFVDSMEVPSKEGNEKKKKPIKSQ
jgi:hypothetical protein